MLYGPDIMGRTAWDLPCALATARFHSPAMFPHLSSARATAAIHDGGGMSLMIFRMQAIIFGKLRPCAAVGCHFLLGKLR